MTTTRRPKRTRVVVTGMGVLAPNGVGLDEFWDSLVQGRSGIGPITLFDARGYRSRIAGEVKDFNPLDYIDPKEKPRRLARGTQLAYAATDRALKDARLNPRQLQTETSAPLPIVMGVGTSAMDILQDGFDSCATADPLPSNLLRSDPARRRPRQHLSAECSAFPRGLRRFHQHAFPGSMPSPPRQHPFAMANRRSR